MRGNKMKRTLACILTLGLLMTGQVSVLAEENPEASGELQTEMMEAGLETTANTSAEVAPEAAEGVQEEAIEETAVPEVVTEEAQPAITELRYEDEQVEVIVSAEEAGIIPESAALKVVPLLPELEETKEQYAEVEQKIQEKAEENENSVAGFLAYDITFVDAAGNEMEPNGKVKVSMNYKEAAIPEAAKSADAETTEVTVLHLEEDENGEVKDVVDMGEAETTQIETEATEEGQKVMAVEAETESFSVFTIIWKGSLWKSELPIQIVNESGHPIGSDTEKEISSAGTVQELAPNVEGYRFKNARVYSYNRVVEIYSLKYEWGKWKYNTSKYGSFQDLNERTVYFIYEENDESGSLKDLHGNKISPEKYNELEANAAEGNLPITWTRSTGVFESEATLDKTWKWDTLMSDLGDDTLTITDPTQVWDGSRSTDGYISTHNFTGYLPNDTITVYQNQMYDSASWKKTDINENYYRFRGVFDLVDLELEEGYSYADYDYTISSVLKEIDNHIYINDNMYVFVYPQNVTLNNQNFTDYLAFWTGTSNQDGITKFHEREGTNAYRPENKPEVGGATSVKELAKITDGWYTNPVSDGAGGIIQDSLNQNSEKTAFYIDVISNDNAAGGAMYRLQLDAKQQQKTEVGFYKVSDKDIDKGVVGAKFRLTNDENKATYPLTSDENGYMHVKLKPGTYTLEEIAAGGGFEKTDNTWTLTVTDKGFGITQKTTPDNNATLGIYEDGARDGKYYITNKDLNTYADLELKKSFIDQEGNPTEAPEGLDHITVKVEGSYQNEETAYEIELNYDEKDKVYKGSTDVISYYDYKVIEEHLWKNKAETEEFVENTESTKGSWEFVSDSYSRFDNATATCTANFKDCSELDRAIQDYEFLLIRTTNIGDYLILNHKDSISDETRRKIVEACEAKHDPNLEYDQIKVIDFDEIADVFKGDVSVIPGAAGSNTLHFAKKNVWTHVWIGEMDITDYKINGTVTNRMLTMDLSIEKVWTDANNKFDTRPEDITVNIKNPNDEIVREVTLEATEDWKTVVTDLPIDEYTIEEATVPGYTPSVEAKDGGYKITNTLAMDWSLYKISENKDPDGNDIPLSGAVFKLRDNDKKLIATYTTGEDGKATVEYASEYDKVPDGTYTLKETIAPIGYVLSDETWNLKVLDGTLVECSSDAGDDSAGTLQTVRNEDGSITVLLTIGNTPVYDLPSTGGVGIFWYIIGGTLLMMAAILLLYKKRMRCEKVRRR